MAPIIFTYIAFGVRVEKDKLPWCKEGFSEGDCDKWWRWVNGYGSRFGIYRQHEDWTGAIELPGAETFDEETERIKVLEDYQEKWDGIHPIPFRPIVFGHNSERYRILTSPQYPWELTRSPSMIFDPDRLRIAEIDENFNQFLLKYLPEVEKPDWILASNYLQ